MFYPPFQSNEQQVNTSPWTQTIIQAGSEIIGHASVLSKGHIITFGGGRNDANPGLKFIMVFNLAKQRQIPRVFNGEFPEMRGHTMCVDQNDNIIVYGGYSGHFNISDRLNTLRMEVHEGKRLRFP